MNDERFERKVRGAARRVASGRAPQSLHERVAAIPAADRRRAGRWSRFGAGLRLAGSAAAIVVLAGAGLVIVATRPHDSAVSPGSTGTAVITAPPATTGSVPVTASPGGSALVTRHLGDLSMVMPADWKVLWPRVWIAPVGPRVFLSNAPIADPCPTAFLNGDECWKPLTELPPGGILVTVGGSAILGASDSSPVVTSRPVGQVCKALGGEREMGAVFSGFGITACLRGPDLAASEAVVRDLVASIKRD